jgi:hypothetical protein
MGVRIPIGFAQVSMDVYLAGNTRAMTCTIGVDALAGQTPVDIADVVQQNMVATNRPWQTSMVPSDWTIGPFRAAIMNEPGIESGVGTLSTVGTATAGLTFPPNVSFLVQKRTGTGGRQGRGRMYEPPITIGETSIDKLGLIQSTIVTDRNTRWEAFRSAIQTLGMGPYLFHEGIGGPLLITKIVLQSLVATQRRRLRH